MNKIMALRKKRYTNPIIISRFAVWIKNAVTFMNIVELANK